jgi:class 3 adenylate cyclase
MLAESTVQRLGGAFAVSPVGALALKGKSEPVRVYHLQSTVAPVGV